MGLGIGIFCERCGKQLAYEQPHLFDEVNKLCGYCVEERMKAVYDSKFPTSPPQGEQKE